MGYMATTGNITTLHSGIAMLFTSLVSDTEDYPAEGFLCSNMTTVATDTDYLFAWNCDATTSALRKRTAGGTWTDEGGYTAGVNFVMETMNYILICPDGGRIRKIEKAKTDAIESSTDATPIVITATAHGLADDDRVTISGHTVNTNANGSWDIDNIAANTFELVGSTATGGGAGGGDGTIYHIHENTGVAAASTDYKWLVAHAGFIYAGKDGASTIFRTSDEDCSTLHGDTATDPDYIAIGGNLPTIGAIVYMKRLFVARWDGLFEIGEDNKARCVLDFSAQTSNTNFRGMAIHNNKLVFPIRDTIYMWNGATLNDITPRFINDRFPYTTYGRYDNLVSTGGYLYLTARDNLTAYGEDLLCWDGVGWHKLLDIVTDGSASVDTVTGMYYDVDLNYLWISVDDGSDGETGTDLIYYVRFQDLSDFPYANFPTSGTHTLDSSRMHMGFQRVTKSTPSILVEAENVTAARYLVVWYSLDGAAWTEWGGTGQGRITSDGLTTKSNPLAAAAGYSTIEYNHIRIRIAFVSDSSTQTPVLEGFTLRFIMRPATLYGHSFNIIAAKAVKVGSARRDVRSVRTIYKAIETARASKSPIVFVDPFGVEVNVYVASVERRAVERHGQRTEGGYPNIESQIIVNVVELG